MSASWTEVPAGITPDAYEADDSAGTAKTISNGQTQNRNIHAAGNVDWVKFTVGGGGAQNVRLETDGASGDSQMWLYGPNSSTTQVTGGYDDDNGNGYFSLITTAANLPATLSPGTYYIKITEFNNDGTIPAYTLRASWTELPITTTTIPVAGDAYGNIATGGVAEMYRFNAVSGTQYTIQTSAGSLRDTFIELYDTDGTTLIDSDDNDGPGLASRIDWTAPASGTYYVKVRGATTTLTGTYRITIGAGTYWTGYQVGQDSMGVPNSRAPGRCLGMSCYSKWYFDNKAPEHGPLVQRFTDTQRETISTEAQDDVFGFGNLDYALGNRSDLEVHEELLMMLALTHKPQIIFMSDKTMFPFWLPLLSTIWNLWQFNDDDKAYHTVLAFDYIETAGVGQFKIYDTWSVTTPNTIEYGGIIEGFRSFSAYNFVDFEWIPESILYSDSTFTGGNYPTP